MMAIPKPVSENAMAIFLAAFWLAGFAIATVIEPLAGIAVALTPVLLYFIAQDRNNLMLLFLFFLPFTNAQFIGENIGGMQGMKVPNILAALIVVSMIFDSYLLVTRDKLERSSIQVFGVYILLFLFAIVRSVPHYKLFHMVEPTLFPDEFWSYILSYVVKPFTIVIPFFVLLKRATTMADIDRVLKTMGLSIFVLSCLVLTVIALNPSVLLDPTRFALADLCIGYFGLHYNDLGTIYNIVCAPMLYLAMKKGNWFWKLNFVLLLGAVLMLESRTTLVGVIIVLLAYMILLRKTTYLWLSVGAGTLLAPVALLPSITALTSVGFGATHGATSTLDAISSGRLNEIWIPYLTEWFTHPALLIFGAGRYGLLTSPLRLTGIALEVGHAHNAFFDFFLDSGLPLLLVLVWGVVRFMRWSWRMGRKLNSPLFWALELSLVGYLIQTVTGTAIYPTLDNMELFPLLALMLNVVRLHMPAPVKAKVRTAPPGIGIPRQVKQPAL
jgi:hypothetical protein